MVARRDGRRPILVTGVPRSGTTWLARWLAAGAGMALPGREPMNPHGRSYALAGTLTGWVRLSEPTPRQVQGALDHQLMQQHGGSGRIAVEHGVGRQIGFAPGGRRVARPRFKDADRLRAPSDR